MLRDWLLRFPPSLEEETRRRRRRRRTRSPSVNVNLNMSSEGNGRERSRTVGGNSVEQSSICRPVRHAGRREVDQSTHWLGQNAHPYLIWVCMMCIEIGRPPSLEGLSSLLGRVILAFALPKKTVCRFLLQVFSMPTGASWIFEIRAC